MWEDTWLSPALTFSDNLKKSEIEMKLNQGYKTVSLTNPSNHRFILSHFQLECCPGSPLKVTVLDAAIGMCMTHICTLISSPVFYNNSASSKGNSINANTRCTSILTKYMVYLRVCDLVQEDTGSILCSD